MLTKQDLKYRQDLHVENRGKIFQEELMCAKAQMSENLGCIWKAGGFARR